MIPKPPIFLFAFANDQQHALQLAEEERKVRELLQQSHDGRKIEHLSLGATSLDDLYKIFNRFHNRIHLFHFSGHSDSTFLELVDQKSRAANLGVIMGMQQNLKLVVLNGCANYQQVTTLLKHGIRAVVATSTPIADNSAILFSTTFYDSLKEGKTIREAFDTTKARLKEDKPDLDIVFRDLSGSEKLDEVAEFPWGLFCTEDADLLWKIPAPYEIPEDLDYVLEVELAGQEINKVLLESTFEGMANFNKKCRFLWEDYQDPDSDDTSVYDLQQEIYTRFPSILSMQIRDLFTENAKQKGRLRLKEIKDTYLVLSKLLSAMALADLWQMVLNAKNDPIQPNFNIRPDYKEDLVKYVQLPKTDADVFDYFWLFITIHHIFIDNGQQSFIVELEQFYEALSENSTFYTSYHFLEFELKGRLHQGNIASVEVSELCHEAEKHLSNLLHHCAFLIAYQLISVNDISVKRSIRTREAEFVHNKIILKGVEDTIMDRSPILKKNYTYNHAIIVTKDFKAGEEQLTLTPFIIDENAYKVKKKEQPKIHFWAGKTEEDKSYYQHAEDLTNGFVWPTVNTNIYRKSDMNEMEALWRFFIEDLGLKS